MSQIAVLIAAALVSFASLVAPSAALAQDEQPPQELRAAAEAYDRGTAAFVSHQYHSAAQWFETAHRLVPSASAILQAVQAHKLAGNWLRAASLTLQMAALYADDAEVVRLSEEILPDATSRFIRVRVSCVECEISLDGRLVTHAEFFVPAQGEHVVSATFATGEARQTVIGAAGEALEMELTAPLEEPPPPDPDPTGDPDPDQLTDPEPGPDPDPDPDPNGDASRMVDSDGLPPWVVYAGAGASALLLGITIWSGVDTLNAANDYEDMPTQQGLDDGLDKAHRTHWLIGATAAMGAGTLILAIVGTDWSGGGARAAQPATVTTSFWIEPGGGTLGLAGRF